MTIQQAVDQTAVRSYRVTGGGGVQLHVEETGNRSGRPVLFLHGLSLCRLVWNKQLHSELTRDLRLVAMDLRGHGWSDRPAGGYGDPAAWAQDVDAVIRSLGLERPVLSGWSYGGVVICDYLGQYGGDALGGVHLVAATSRLGEPAMPFLGPRFLAAVPGLLSTDPQVIMDSIEAFVRLLTAADPTPEDFYFRVGCTAAVSSRVRQELLSRTCDNDALLARLDKPVLITHGTEDEIVLPSMGRHHADLIPRARISSYPGIGHATFWEDPDRFNSELLAFAAAL